MFFDNFDVASGSMIILELFRACLHIWHAKLDSAMDIASTGWPPYVQLKEKKQSFFVAYSINHTFYSWQIFKTNGFSSCICIKKADLKENVVRRRDWASLFQSSLNKEGFNICQLYTKIKDFPVQFVYICHACIDIKIRKFFYRTRDSYS